jgi:hypothetical protein
MIIHNPFTIYDRLNTVIGHNTLAFESTPLEDILLELTDSTNLAVLLDIYLDMDYITTNLIANTYGLGRDTAIGYMSIIHQANRRINTFSLAYVATGEQHGVQTVN